MSYSENTKLEKVYSARTDQQRRAAYNDWAEDYDKDVGQFGIRIPAVAAVMFARHVKASGPFLDAGCGTGMHIEPLILAGFSSFTGIDISDGMLEKAALKNFYKDLIRMSLSGPLDFPDDHFSTSYCIGALAAGHVPPQALDELIRVTKPGGLVIFSLHAHNAAKAQAYQKYRADLNRAGKWELIDETEPFISMPGGDQTIKHAVYIYRVT